MKKTKMLAGVLALSMIFAGCGKADNETKESSVEETTAAETTEAETTEEATEAETTTEAEEIGEGEPEEEEPASEEELQEVKDIIAAYETALKADDYETMVDLTDVDLLQYIATGKEGTKEELVALLKGETGDENTIVVKQDYSNTVFGEPRCYNSQAKMFNDFLASDAIAFFAEEGEGVTDAADKFTIDGLYAFSMSSETSAETSSEIEDGEGSMSFSSNGSFDMDMYVVHINGEWKVDSGFIMVAGMYQAFSGMAEENTDKDLDMDEVEVEAEDAEEATTEAE